jgi:putative transposase
MCHVLQVPRSTYYDHKKQIEQGLPMREQCKEEDPDAEVVCEVFEESRQTYGTRRIKAELQTRGIVASRRRIGRIMKAKGLVSCYTKPSYKPHRLSSNTAKLPNLLNRQFRQEEARKAVVSDLTYIRVGDQWHYICVLLDIFNREIIGHSTGKRKDKELVLRAFASVQGSLAEVEMFHTDRGGEFANHALDEMLATFGIQRSLSMRGCPYDNAVAEATFKTIKTELRSKKFTNLEQLTLEFQDFVNWYNRIRRHSTLGNLSPEQFKKKNSRKLSD